MALAAPFVSACAGPNVMARASAGQVGCPREAIQIVNVDHGMTTTNWVAICRGRKYACTGMSSGHGGSTVSCHPMYPERQVVVIRETAPSTSGVAPTTSSGRPTSRSEPAREEALRGVIAGQRDAILACGPRVPVGVRATVQSTGALAVSLTGALAGTAEEGCVQAVFAETVLATELASTTVVHVVR